MPNRLSPAFADPQAGRSLVEAGLPSLPALRAPVEAASARDSSTKTLQRQRPWPRRGAASRERSSTPQTVPCAPVRKSMCLRAILSCKLGTCVIRASLLTRSTLPSDSESHRDRLSSPGRPRCGGPLCRRIPVGCREKGLALIAEDHKFARCSGTSTSHALLSVAARSDGQRSAGQPCRPHNLRRRGLRLDQSCRP